MTTLGQYIAKRRGYLQLTQEDLAARLGKLGLPRAATTIANWEADRSPVPVELLNSLAEALEEPSPVTLYDLAGILDKIPGGDIVRLLRDVPIDDVRRVERMIRAYLQEKDH